MRDPRIFVTFMNGNALELDEGSEYYESQEGVKVVTNDGTMFIPWHNIASVTIAEV